MSDRPHRSRHFGAGNGVVHPPESRITELALRCERGEDITGVEEPDWRDGYQMGEDEDE